MSEDIVERLLREDAEDAWGSSILNNPDGPEAADEIVALREQLAEARGEVAQIVAWLRDGAMLAHKAADECKSSSSAIALRMQADTFSSVATAIAAGQHKGEQS